MSTATVTVKKIVKPTTPKEEKLTQKNKAIVTSKAAQEIIIHRDLKYLYPKDCKDTLSRKSHRQKVRNTLRKMERELHGLKGEDKKNMQTKITEYRTMFFAL